MREKLAELERSKEADRSNLSERIEDLRRDRDDLRGERDKLLKVIEEQAGSVRLLTDQSRPAAPEAAQEPPQADVRGFWGRLRYVATGRE